MTGMCKYEEVEDLNFYGVKIIAQDSMVKILYYRTGLNYFS